MTAPNPTWTAGLEEIKHCEGLEISSYLQANWVAWCSFVDVGRWHKIPESDMKGLIFTLLHTAQWAAWAYLDPFLCSPSPTPSLLRAMWSLSGRCLFAVSWQNRKNPVFKHFKSFRREQEEPAQTLPWWRGYLYSSSLLTNLPSSPDGDAISIAQDCWLTNVLEKRV